MVKRGGEPTPIAPEVAGGLLSAVEKSKLKSFGISFFNLKINLLSASKFSFKSLNNGP
jgi:hypothetical protein